MNVGQTEQLQSRDRGDGYRCGGSQDSVSQKPLLPSHRTPLPVSCPLLVPFVSSALKSWRVPDEHVPTHNSHTTPAPPCLHMDKLTV